MSLRENLLKKIAVRKLSERVVNSLGPPGSGRKIDREAMRELLEMAAYRHQRARDLDLYLEPDPEESPDPCILILDNELPRYRATVADVVMRRSPEIREMISIRNIIKILNDKDILLSRGEQTVSRVRDICVAGLDVTWGKEDLEAIKFDGQASLESSYPEGVLENLMLFAEILGWQSPPPPFQMDHCVMYGHIDLDNQGKTVWGPSVVYHQIHRELTYLDTRTATTDRTGIESYRTAAGDAAATIRGKAVFQKLVDLSLKNQTKTKGGLL